MAAIAVCAAAGCSDSQSYTAGDPENPDTYGVYFPSQTSTTTVEIDPGEKTEVTYTARRSSSLDAIVVPVNVTSSEEGIFVIETIAFGAGEDETTFKVCFPDAEVGKKYTCTISIDDPAYVEVYGTKSTSLSISVVRAGWKAVTGEDGSTSGKWRDDIIGNLYTINSSYFVATPEIDVQIYEREDMPGYYRMKVYAGDTFLNAMSGGIGVSISSNTDEWTVVDAQDPDKVYIPLQSTGLTFSSSDGVVSIGSYVPENFSLDESAAQYGTLKDGVITFPAQSIYGTVSSITGYYALNKDGLTRLLLPGVTVPDYTVTLSAGTQENGAVPVTAVLSDDVASFRYSIFEGVMDDGTASLNAQDMDAGNISFDGQIEESSTIEVKPASTGKYSLLGCIYDKNGIMQDYVYVSFGYVADGDSRPVNLKFGLESTNEYAAQGISSDNAVKFYAYGDEIESVTYGFFKTSDISGYTLDEALDKAGEDFTDDMLSLVNGTGFSTMLTGLNGDTDYTMAVRAYNGYTTETSSVSIRTTGTYNPGLDTFTYSDFMDSQPNKFILTTREWNYYAVNYADDEPVRRSMGTVKISDNSTESTSSAQYLNITGLAGIDFDSGGTMLGAYIPGTSGLSSYKGAFTFYAPQSDALGQKDGEDVYFGFIPDEDMGYVYVGWGMFFGQVADGYLYCVPSPQAEEQGYTFHYLYVASNNVLYGLVSEMLLVDPSKDMGGISQSSAALARMARIRKAASREIRPRNFVELPEYSDAVDIAGNDDILLNLAVYMKPASAPAVKEADVKAVSVPLSGGRGNAAFVAGKADFIAADAVNL